MSNQNSGRSLKSLSGNGIDPPHMQSSLSPQGYGLYNYNSFVGGCGRDTDSVLDSTSITSGWSPLKKQTISSNDYLVAHPQHNSSNVRSALMQDPPRWKQTGNENLTTHNSLSASGSDGTPNRYVNSTTTAPFFDLTSFGSPSNGSGSIIDAKTLEKSHQKLHQQQQYTTSNNSITTKTAIPPTMRYSNGEGESKDRSREKDRLIDSLAKSDMITCLPGFKKGPELSLGSFGGIEMGSNSKYDITHSTSGRDGERKPCGRIKAFGPLSPSGSFNRHTPASPSANQTYNISSPREPAKTISPFNSDSDFRSVQQDVSNIHQFLENDSNKYKPTGAWKNMGTPFSDPQTKSAQRLQQSQYRQDLERQIHASQLRKAEENRKEKDGGDHPLGPQYAHPALTYYNPPRQINGGGVADRGVTCSTTTTGPLTKYMKEKYALGAPISSGSRNTIVTGDFTPGNPQQTGGSSTVLGRLGPLSQAKKEQALANLMKSRNCAGGGGSSADENHSVQSLPPQVLSMNQCTSSGTNNGPGADQSRNDMPQWQQRQPLQQSNNQYPFVGQPDRSNRLARNQKQSRQQGHPPSPQQLQQNPHPMNPPAWPMPMYPSYYGAYPYYPPYGQPMHPSANHSQANSQQQPQYPPYQQQQPQFKHEKTSSPQPQRLSQPAPLPSIIHDRHVDEDRGRESGADSDSDGEEFEMWKKEAYKAQKIWQTSDELPDPVVKTAVYKAELRKQIVEDKKRKEERRAKEKAEDDRIEKKIREFHEEERKRLRAEEETRAGIERFHHKHHKIERPRKKSDALTITRKPKPVQRRPRSRSSLLAEKLASFGPDAGDFPDPDEFYDEYNPDGLEFGDHVPEKLDKSPIRHRQVISPPIPVVQKKLIEKSLEPKINPNSQLTGFFSELKSRLESDRNLLERRLQEKLESTHKNMNLLKYTMNHK